MPALKIKPAAPEDTSPFSNSHGLSVENQQRFDIAECTKPATKKRRASTGPWETISDFALNVSSAHGLPNIFRAKTKAGRVVWSLIFMAGIAVALWQGALLVINYLDFQVTVEVSIFHTRRQSILPIRMDHAFPTSKLVFIEN